MDYGLSVEKFLREKNKFKLGDLATEQSHPLTSNLSEVVRLDVEEALSLCFQVDELALAKFKDSLPELEKLKTSVTETLGSGDRIFLVGCGATGRLSLSLEYLWRGQFESSDQVCSLMAGGDTALIHALEGFEDHPEFGARHLCDLGFGANDLLIATTEGGETPYVIGATEFAAENSTRNPFFLYCNPKEVLSQKVERSRQVFENPRINDICLFVGPMAIAGSTRMQASTILMLAVGLCLFESVDRWKECIDSLTDGISKLSLKKMSYFVTAEAEIYNAGDFSLYEAEEFAITVLTDTTERSPTFSLSAFENKDHPKESKSLTYLSIPSADSPEQAWEKLLRRKPSPLNWLDVHMKTKENYMYGFHFHDGAHKFRKNIIPESKHHVFKVGGDKDNFIFKLNETKEEFGGAGTLWLTHILLKMTLNAHSTLVMGLLGRYRGNLMTHVVPTNGKLVDRSIRYIEQLLRIEGLPVPNYDEIAIALFNEIPKHPEGTPLVLETFKKLGS